MGRRILALCGLMLAASGGRLIFANQDTLTQEQSHPVVPVRLVVRGLGAGSIELLQREVEAIWAAHRVKIMWITDEVRTAVVVVVDRPESALPPSPATEQWHIAATRLVEGHIVPVMYVSLDAAARVAQGTSPPYSSPSLAGVIVPRIAARAVAHELAHFLLDTREHTPRGLLRARFSAHDFVNPFRDTFLLDAGQIAAVHHRLKVTPIWASSGVTPRR